VEQYKGLVCKVQTCLDSSRQKTTLGDSPSALWCSSPRRASTAGSVESQTPSEVSSWRALPGAPSARRARTAAAVRYEAWGEAPAASGADAPVVARVRGPSASAARFTRATRSSKGSRTEDRKLMRHCCVGEDRVTFPPRAGAPRATREKAVQGLPRLLAFHCMLQPGRARAQLEEAVYTGAIIGLSNLHSQETWSACSLVHMVHMVQKKPHLANPPGPRPQSCLWRHPPTRGCFTW